MPLRNVPFPDLSNPPGRPELSWRVGTWETFLRQMLAAVPRVVPPPSPPAPAPTEPPLARLNLSSQDSWVRALLEAWASVADVLSFYNERILQEGYLGTAVEDRSVRFLVGLLGYQPRPAIASSTLVALRTGRAPGVPESILLRPGIGIQSLPLSGSLPETFETDEALVAYPDLDNLRPRLPERVHRQTLDGASTSLIAEGTRTGLRKGQAILVSGSPASGGTGSGATGSGATGSSGKGSGGTGSGSTIARRWLRFVSDVEARAAPRRTVQEAFRQRLGPRGTSRVSWSEALEPDAPGARFEAPELLGFGQRASLFGHDAPAFDSQPEAVQRSLRPLRGGVLVADPPWTRWVASNQGLPAVEARALAADSEGRLFAAVSQQGVWASPDGGASWSAPPKSLTRADVTALAVEASDFVLAGTSDGKVYRSLDAGADWSQLTGSTVERRGKRSWKRVDTRLPRVTVRDLGSFVGPGGIERILVATDQGVFRSREQADGWDPVNSGLPGTDSSTGQTKTAVTSLAVTGLPGVVFAGSAQGVFRSTSGGGSWVAASQGLPETDPSTGLSQTAILCLVADTDRRTRTTRLWAGTAIGVFRSDDLGRSWLRASMGLPGAETRRDDATVKVVDLIAFRGSHSVTLDLFAATASGLFLSGDHGDSWAPVAEPAGGASVAAVAVTAEGRVAAATPPAGVSPDTWPGFRLEDGRVDLDRVYQRVVAGGLVVLQQSAEDPGDDLVGIYPILDVSTVDRSDFSLTATVTRLQVDPKHDLGAFDLRSTVVWVESSPVELQVQTRRVVEPQDADVLELARPLEDGFDDLRPALVVGKAIRATLGSADGDDDGNGAASPAYLARPTAGGAPFRIAAGETVTVVAPPETRGDDLVLEVETDAGQEGIVQVPESAVTWRAARDDDESRAAATQVRWWRQRGPRGQPRDRLSFTPSLGVAFDPATVVVHANAVPVSQGRSVGREVLGSGDSSRSNQRFVLSQPVTYLPARTAEGLRSTLEVRVDGVRWREVERLEEASPDDAVYMLRQRPDRRSEVVFGDGVHGARLPSGRENVAVTYRTGGGLQPVPAGHLTLLQDRPFGLRGATNPLPVPGGTPAEDLDRTRARAPEAVTVLERVVSLGDVGDFARTYPGVDDAVVAVLWTGHQRLIQVTLAPQGGGVDAVGSVLPEDLAAALAAAGAESWPLDVALYEAARFGVSARILVAEGHPSRAVLQAVRAALNAAFGYAAAQFGASVTTADVLGVMIEVSGVETVGSLEIYRSATPGHSQRRLTARAARMVDGQVVAAELLVLDADSVQLEVEGRAAGSAGRGSGSGSSSDEATAERVVLEGAPPEDGADGRSDDTAGGGASGDGPAGASEPGDTGSSDGEGAS